MTGKAKDQSSDKWSMGMQQVKVDLPRALTGGIIACIIIFIGSWLVGDASQTEPYKLFSSALPRIRSFSGTLIIALGNILALMLTLLSLSFNVNIDISWSHFQRVRQVSWSVAVILIFTVLGTLLMNIPLVESEKAPNAWFAYLYYGLLIFSALLGGAFVTVILLLYNTVRDIIGVLNPNKAHTLDKVKEEEE